jgi:glucose/arabinose dehydrogenase
MRRFTVFIAPVLAVATLAGVRAHRAPACDPDNAGLVLPKGFCATLFATVPNVRNLTVAPNGDVFAGGQQSRRGVTALRDRDGDGHADSTVTFGESYGPGSGIQLGPDALYFSPNNEVVRFVWKSGEMAPSDAGTVIVSGLPVGGNHNWKTLALGKDGGLFVDHGSATNSCQEADRATKSPGKSPCTELDVRAGTWRYDARGTGQTPSIDKRWATGFRNGEAIAIHPETGVLWGATHGRDQLGGSWGFSNEDNAEKPAEEFGMLAKGADYGWPYCYYDPIAHKKVQAPEYGGDGVKQGDCGSKTQPAIAFPGHWAPMQLAFVPAHTAFGAEFAGGAFLAFHGSWNRAPLPQAGFRVVFIPFKNGKAGGEYTTFATGAGGPTGLRASGVAMAPDGSALYIGSDAAGKIWRVIPTPTR